MRGNLHAIKVPSAVRSSQRQATIATKVSRGSVQSTRSTLSGAHENPPIEHSAQNAPLDPEASPDNQACTKCLLLTKFSYLHAVRMLN